MSIVVFRGSMRWNSLLYIPCSGNRPLCPKEATLVMFSHGCSLIIPQRIKSFLLVCYSTWWWHGEALPNPAAGRRWFLHCTSGHIPHVSRARGTLQSRRRWPVCEPQKTMLTGVYAVLTPFKCVSDVHSIVVWLKLLTLKHPSRQPTVCCCVVIAYTNRGGRPGLPDWGFKLNKGYLVKSICWMKFQMASPKLCWGETKSVSQKNWNCHTTAI